jgi:hypothetical protein
MALIGKKAESIPTGLALVLGKVNPLSDPSMRMFVRSAVTEGDYAAAQSAYVLAERLLPPGSELWTWWLDGVEDLVRTGDEDSGLFVSFTRNVAGIAPWGTLPAGAQQRLRALSS